MRIDAKKMLWWWLLASGIGGTLLFAGLVTEHGAPRGQEALLWAWPVITTILSLIAPFQLWRLYKLEPATGPGLWQLGMLDLASAAGLAGLSFTFWQFDASAHLLTMGVPITLLGTALYVSGLLTASRKGFDTFRFKFLFATGYVLRIYGTLTVGAMAVFMVAGLCFGATPWEVIERFIMEDRAEWTAVFLRTGLVVVMPGWILHATVRPKQPVTSPPA